MLIGSGVRALIAAVQPTSHPTAKLAMPFSTYTQPPYCSLQGLIPQAQSKKPVTGGMQVRMLCRMARVLDPDSKGCMTKCHMYLQAAVHDANIYEGAGHVSLSFEADDLSSSDFSGHLTDHADIIEDAQEAQWP